jgi:hypothetical protein
VDAAKIIVKYSTIDNDGPTGMFFNNESNSADVQNPW